MDSLALARYAVMKAVVERSGVVVYNDLLMSVPVSRRVLDTVLEELEDAGVIGVIRVFRVQPRNRYAGSASARSYLVKRLLGEKIVFYRNLPRAKLVIELARLLLYRYGIRIRKSWKKSFTWFLKDCLPGYLENIAGAVAELMVVLTEVLEQEQVSV